MTRILPSGRGTATSASLSVLAWIWLMDPRLPLILPMAFNYWRRFVCLVFTVRRVA